MLKRSPSAEVAEDTGESVMIHVQISYTYKSLLICPTDTVPELKYAHIPTGAHQASQLPYTYQ